MMLAGGGDRMDYKYLLLENEGGIATLTLNRPEKMNTLIPQMRVEIRQALENINRDDSIRVMILTGAGQAFCAGADIASVEARAEMADDEPVRQLFLKPVQTARLIASMRELNKPTICALNGVAAGAGCGLAVACDIIIASDKARYRIAITRMGGPVGDGLSYFLPRKISIHRALELVYTNDIIDAREMERIGLVNRVVPQDELMKAAKEMARKMLQIPPVTLALAKKSIYQGASALSPESQEMFDSLVASRLEKTEDMKEAQRSFIEKREPKYKGR
jgi:2-(1,2-epoxy-1,2-dihydrophenyl)acetyl-CoA isomerase